MSNDYTHVDEDMRRAYALLAHYSGDDGAGVNAIIDEAERAGRLGPLLWCVAAGVAALVPGWHTPATTDVLRAHVAAFAAREHADQP